MNLRKDFQDHVVKSAFKMVDDELRIIGKYGQLTVIGDLYDFWFVGPDLSPLSTRRLNILRQTLPKNVPFTQLDGEGIARVGSLDLALKLLPFMGVRQKRKLSLEEKKKLTDRLAKARCTA